MRRPALLAAIVAVLTLVPAACGDTEADGDRPALSVGVAWVPETAVDAAAVYLTLVNEGGPDRMTSATVDGATVELHEAVERDGLVFMEPRDALEIGGDTVVALEPLGRHLMVTDLGAPLEPGDRISLELRFERSDPLVVEVEVVAFAEHLDRLESLADD